MEHIMWQVIYLDQYIFSINRNAEFNICLMQEGVQFFLELHSHEAVVITNLVIITKPPKHTDPKTGFA